MMLSMANMLRDSVLSELLVSPERGRNETVIRQRPRPVAFNIDFSFLVPVRRNPALAAGQNVGNREMDIESNRNRPADRADMGVRSVPEARNEYLSVFALGQGLRSGNAMDVERRPNYEFTENREHARRNTGARNVERDPEQSVRSINYNSFLEDYIQPEHRQGLVSSLFGGLKFKELFIDSRCVLTRYPSSKLECDQAASQEERRALKSIELR